jgi:hypothetical protein
MFKGIPKGNKRDVEEVIKPIPDLIDPYMVHKKTLIFSALAQESPSMIITCLLSSRYI